MLNYPYFSRKDRKLPPISFSVEVSPIYLRALVTVSMIESGYTYCTSRDILGYQLLESYDTDGKDFNI